MWAFAHDYFPGAWRAARLLHFLLAPFTSFAWPLVYFVFSSDVIADVIINSHGTGALCYNYGRLPTFNSGRFPCVAHMLLSTAANSTGHARGRTCWALLLRIGRATLSATCSATSFLLARFTSLLARTFTSLLAVLENMGVCPRLNHALCRGNGMLLSTHFNMWSCALFAAVIMAMAGDLLGDFIFTLLDLLHLLETARHSFSLFSERICFCALKAQKKKKIRRPSFCFSAVQ